MVPFNYRSKGMLASLGGYRGVAEIFGIQITGLLAWVIWRAIYIGMLPGFTTRLRVALNWLFDYFLPRTIVHMSDTKSTATKTLAFAMGNKRRDSLRLYTTELGTPSLARVS